MKVLVGVEVQAINVTPNLEGNASDITKTETLTPSLMNNSSGM